MRWAEYAALTVVWMVTFVLAGLLFTSAVAVMLFPVAIFGYLTGTLLPILGATYTIAVVVMMTMMAQQFAEMIEKINNHHDEKEAKKKANKDRDNE